jgi:uncharacterized C2H2 Zn-finger protein
LLVNGFGRPGRAEATTEETAEKELVYEFHGHLVVEEAADNESMLRCVRCGVSVPLMEASSLAEKPCQEKRNEPQTLCGCGRQATKLMPSYDPITMTFKDLRLCDACVNDYLNILRRSGPAVGKMRGRIPPNSYWFDLYNTVFMELGNAYPCPGCDQFFDNLYEVVKHFGEKHIDKTRPPEEAVIDGFEAIKTWQYIWCKRCLRWFENERHFRSHIRDHMG